MATGSTGVSGRETLRALAATQAQFRNYARESSVTEPPLFQIDAGTHNAWRVCHGRYWLLETLGSMSVLLRLPSTQNMTCIYALACLAFFLFFLSFL